MIKPKQTKEETISSLNYELSTGQIFSIDKEYIRLFPCMGIERTDTGMNFKRYASTPLINRCSQFYNIQKPSAYKPKE